MILTFGPSEHGSLTNPLTGWLKLVLRKEVVHSCAAHLGCTARGTFYTTAVWGAHRGTEPPLKHTSKPLSQPLRHNPPTNYILLIHNASEQLNGKGRLILGLVGGGSSVKEIQSPTSTSMGCTVACDRLNGNKQTRVLPQLT